MPELTEGKVDDTLGMYLAMLRQHDQAVVSATGNRHSKQLEMVDKSGAGTKWAASLGTSIRIAKRPKSDNSDFPWVVHVQLSDCRLPKSLKTMLTLLQAFSQDLKFTKSPILNSRHALPFPSSEWSNIITRVMVNLNHVILGSFTVSNDNQETELIRGMEVKFSVSKPLKTVTMSGEWFIAWGAYKNATTFVFSHWKDELQVYGWQILGLFMATAPCNHTAIINLDKGI
jgi:hypothetical protein